MATKKQFEQELAKHPGATLDTETCEFDFHVDAPKGFMWRDGGVHCLTADHRNVHGQSYKAQAYADLIDRMRLGLEPCFDEDCATCALRSAITTD